jgi:hypothetical protein
VSKTGHWFRRYFANLLMFSRPTNAMGLFKDDRIFHQLREGLLPPLDEHNRKEVEQEILKRLEYYFQQNNTSCKYV